MKKEKKGSKSGKGIKIGVFAPAAPWCVGFVKPDVCVKARWKTFVLGEWAYLGAVTLYDFKGKAHRLSAPYFMRIGKLEGWARKGKKKK